MGAGSRTGSRGGQPQQLGGMDTQLISFSMQRQTAINANALQKPRGFCRENFKRSLLNTTKQTRMSGTLARVIHHPSAHHPPLLPCCIEEGEDEKLQ